MTESVYLAARSRRVYHGSSTLGTASVRGCAAQRNKAAAPCCFPEGVERSIGPRPGRPQGLRPVAVTSRQTRSPSVSCRRCVRDHLAFSYDRPGLEVRFVLVGAGYLGWRWCILALPFKNEVG